MLIVAAQIRFSSRMRPDQKLRGSPRQSSTLVGHRARNTRHAPDHEPDEEADLPEASKLDVGEALVAEPEPALLDVAHDAEPIADQRTRDDDQRHPKQDVDEECLPARLAAAGDGGRQEQAGADPRHPDPNDWRLNVHVAQEIKWQVVVRARDRRSCADRNKQCAMMVPARI